MNRNKRLRGESNQGGEQMSRCWTCGAYIERPLFKCKIYSRFDELQKLSKVKVDNLRQLAEVQQRYFEKFSEVLPDIASIIEWGLLEVSWRLQQQTEVLSNIDKTLKTHSQKEANEWRLLAEEFKEKGSFNKSKNFFLMSLDENPSDYRTYIGLAQTYLHLDMFDKAKETLEESIPFAPKSPLDRKYILSKANRKSHPESIKTVEDADEYLEWLEEEYKTRKRDKSEKDKIDYNIYLPTNYRSYSYRLIGHIHECNEEYSQAVSVLQTAVELSPTYYLAYFDLAKYSAQIKDREVCISALKKAIEGYPFFFNIAEVEKDFNSISSDVKNFLKEIGDSVHDAAKIVISETEKELELAKMSVNRAQKTFNKCPNQPSIGLNNLKNAKRMLNLARNRVNLKDYKAYLEAIPIAKDAYNLAKRAKEEADEKRIHYKNTAKRRKRNAIKNIPFSILLTMVFIFAFFLAFGLIGFIIGAGFDDWEAGLRVGFISGSFLGLLVGIVLSVKSFLEKTREYIK